MLVLLASKQGSPRGTEPHISPLPAIETQLRLVRLLQLHGMAPDRELPVRSSVVNELYSRLVVSEVLLRPHCGGRCPLRWLPATLSVRRLVQAANSAGCVLCEGRGEGRIEDQIVGGGGGNWNRTSERCPMSPIHGATASPS